MFETTIYIYIYILFWVSTWCGHFTGNFHLDKMDQRSGGPVCFEGSPIILKDTSVPILYGRIMHPRIICISKEHYTAPQFELCLATRGW